MRKLARELFDFEEMTRRTLSRHWSAELAEERAEFVRLFTDLLERAYVGRIEAYGGENIVYIGEAVDAGYATVRSKIVTAAAARSRSTTGSISVTGAGACTTS